MKHCIGWSLYKKSKLIKPDLLSDLMHENEELLKIIISSIKTMRARLNKDN